MNRKRAKRLWRDEVLWVPPASPSPQRLGNSTLPPFHLQAERPNQVWALDFVFDTTAHPRPFKVHSMCDEFIRESVGGRLDRSITADDVVAALHRLHLQRGGPKYIHSDNGTEFVTEAIRDSCRFSGTGSSFTYPGSLWHKASVESYNEKVRGELFALEIFHSILETPVLYEDRRHASDLACPHRSLELRTPAVLAAALNHRKLFAPLE